jgi:predicted Na+-dependent transporter
MKTGSLRNLLRALAAVLAGNAAYFLMMPVLPLAVRHVPYRLDGGLVVDFVLCVIAFAGIKVLFKT